MRITDISKTETQAEVPDKNRCNILTYTRAALRVHCNQILLTVTRGILKYY